MSPRTHHTSPTRDIPPLFTSILYVWDYEQIPCFKNCRLSLRYSSFKSVKLGHRISEAHLCTFWKISVWPSNFFFCLFVFYLLIGGLYLLAPYRYFLFFSLKFVVDISCFMSFLQRTHCVSVVSC